MPTLTTTLEIVKKIHNLVKVYKLLVVWAGRVHLPYFAALFVNVEVVRKMGVAVDYSWKNQVVWRDPRKACRSFIYGILVVPSSMGTNMGYYYTLETKIKWITRQESPLLKAKDFPPDEEVISTRMSLFKRAVNDKFYYSERIKKLEQSWTKWMNLRGDSAKKYKCFLPSNQALPSQGIRKSSSRTLKNRYKCHLPCT